MTNGFAVTPGCAGHTDQGMQHACEGSFQLRLEEEIARVDALDSLLSFLFLSLSISTTYTVCHVCSFELHLKDTSSAKRIRSSFSFSSGSFKAGEAHELPDS